MDQHTNFGFSIVAVAPSPALSGTTLEVQPGQGALFPSGTFNCTVWPSVVAPIASNAEIIRVTRVGDVFTIVRAQEGTTARAIAVGYQIANTQTVKVFTDIEDAISTESAARSAQDDVLSAAVSVVSNALSVETAARTSVDTAHAQSISVLSHAVSVVSQALSSEVATRAAGHSVLSLADTALSGRIDITSALATSAHTRLNTVSAVSAATSVNGLQSVVNQLSSRISGILAGGGISVTSAEVQGVSAQAASAVSVTSAAVTSVNTRVTSVNTFISSISARSAGNVSTHGFQSIVDALSSRISAAAGGAGSATSAEVEAVSAQAASAINVASLAATSVNTRVNSVNTFISGISARSVGNVSTHGFQSIINALSGRISAAGAGSVTSAELQTVSAQAASALSDALSMGEVTASEMSLRVNSVNTFLSGVSARSVGNVSTHGLQSVFDALSGRVSAASAAAASADSHANTASAAATSAHSRLNTVSAVSAGTSVNGLQSVVNQLSSRISGILAGGGISVTSAELQGVSAQANSAIQVVSAAAASVDSRMTSVNTFISGISARSIGNVSTHGFQSVIDALSGHISAASAAAASADAHAATASAAATSVDARLNALSDRVVSISAQLVSVDTHAGTASAAATSVDSRLNNVSAVSGATSVKGLQSVINQLSNRISAVTGSSVTSAEVQTASAAATSVNTRVTSVNTFISGISSRSVGDVSTHGFQSVIDALSGHISAASAAATSADAHAAAASAAATSVDTRLNTLSDRVVSISAQLVSVDTHANTASAAATSVDARVNSVNVFVSGISSRSVGDVSTHGFQSVVNALSNRISAIVAGAASATSNELSAVQASVNGISNFLSGLSTRSGGTSIKGLQSIINSFSNRISAVAGGSVTSNEASAISAQAASALSNAISAGEVTASELSARITSVNAFISGVSSRSAGDVSTHGFQSVINALSNRISAGGGSVTSSEVSAVSQNASVNNASIIAFISGISSRSVGDVSTHGLQSVVNALSDRISAIVAGAASVTSNELSAVQASVNGISNFLSGLSARSAGNVSTKGLQSILNALSSRISAVGAGSVTSNEASAISAQAASALSNAISAGEVTASELSARIASVNTFISGISSRSVGDVSTHGLQSVVNALSNRISANMSAFANASTVGSLAGLSLAIANDASVSAAIINNISVQQGAGQFKVVTGAQGISTGVFTKVSGLSLSLGGSNIYKVEGQINYAPNATSGTAVFQLGMSATAQPVYAALRFQGPSAIAAGATQHNTMFGGESAISATPSVMYSVKPGVSGNGHMVFFDGIIQASTVATQLKVVAATTTTNNGGCTIRVGSYIRAYRIG